MLHIVYAIHIANIVYCTCDHVIHIVNIMYCTCNPMLMLCIVHVIQLILYIAHVIHS